MDNPLFENNVNLSFDNLIFDLDRSPDFDDEVDLGEFKPSAPPWKVDDYGLKERYPTHSCVEMETYCSHNIIYVSLYDTLEKNVIEYILKQVKINIIILPVDEDKKDLLFTLEVLTSIIGSDISNSRIGD